MDETARRKIPNAWYFTFLAARARVCKGSQQVRDYTYENLPTLALAEIFEEQLRLIDTLTVQDLAIQQTRLVLASLPRIWLILKP